jgi:hypothetical protein
MYGMFWGDVYHSLAKERRVQVYLKQIAGIFNRYAKKGITVNSSYLHNTK